MPGSERGGSPIDTRSSLSSPAGHHAADSHHVRYLPFVDGLRAVSILAVVGCHIGLPGFSGGYVGVDVFFVISGFLIVNQIKDDLSSGRFSILSFYARRTLRILPPYLIVLLAVFAVAPFILPVPRTAYDFALSVLLSPVMLTNVLFYTSQGYFDISANDKPLLHTWTLSVEEQFYLVAPLLLLLVFRLGGRRFGALALAIALTLGAASFAGSIARTSMDGPNAAFYLMHWRMWEFIGGGLIGGPLIAAVQRWPRAIVEAMGIAGIAAIVMAVATFGSATQFPSWRAALPAGGAMLVILAGVSLPRIFAVRFLALKWMVTIGLVSYGWYLWHWPILSFLRIHRFGEASLLQDVLGAGVLAFALAWLSYRYVELPIRRWRRSDSAVRRAGAIFACGLAATATTALIGGAAGYGTYRWISWQTATMYGVDGKGALDNGCRLIASTSIPAACLDGKVGILLGDSHANSMFGSLARTFKEAGMSLIYIGRGGCDPLRFAVSERRDNRRHGCANLLEPFERLLVRDSPVISVVVTPPAIFGSGTTRLWSELLSQFDPAKTRILVILPAPALSTRSLECVVLSDRHLPNRDRCVRPRSEVEAARKPILDAVMPAADRLPNVRTIDPIDLFCDATLCKPFDGNRVFYADATHLLTSGTDRIQDRFEAEFRWIQWRP